MFIASSRILPRQADNQPTWITGTQKLHLTESNKSIVLTLRSKRHSEKMSEQYVFLGFQQPQLSVNTRGMFFFSRHRVIVFSFKPTVIRF